MLPTIASAVQTLGHHRVKPSVYLRPTAHPTSRNAARKRSSQGMANPTLRVIKPISCVTSGVILTANPAMNHRKGDPPPPDTSRFDELGHCPECNADMVQENATGERMGLYYRCSVHGRFRYSWDEDRLERDTS
jgi:hypothetical protein